MHRWRINIHPCSTSLTPFRWQHTPCCWGIRRNRYRTPIVCTIRHCCTVYSDVFDANTETNNNYNIHERNENSSSKRTHLLFWSIQWDRVHGLKIIVADIFMEWLIQFYTLMMIRQSCSPLKFLAVGLIKKINVLVLLLMYKSTEICLLNLYFILPHSIS